MKKKGLLIFTLVALSALVVLIVTYAGKVSMLYLKTDEVLARLDNKPQNPSQSLVGQYFRIHGTLKPGTHKRIRGRIDYQFEIMGKSGRSIKVNYSGILPDTFRDKAELVLEGKLLTRNKFKAFSVFAKCPSKYQEERNGKHPKGIKRSKGYQGSTQKKTSI